MATAFMCALYFFLFGAQVLPYLRNGIYMALLLYVPTPAPTHTLRHLYSILPTLSPLLI